MIEEKDSVGAGKVFVGHAQECTLRGLEPLTEHIYRMRCKTTEATTATPWLTVYTKKEPISCEHLIRACLSSGIQKDSIAVVCLVSRKYKVQYIYKSTTVHLQCYGRFLG